MLVEKPRCYMDVLLPEPNDALEVILKVVGEACNINCHYCYERRRPYEDATVLSATTLRDFLARMGGRPLSVGLHGGEPLLVKHSHMAELLGELARYPGRVQLKLQTNATLLTQEWLDLFEQHWPSLVIGLSLDGHAEVNGHRVDHQNRPVDTQITAALKMLDAAGRQVGVISTVTRRALGQELPILQFFQGFRCIRAVSFAPCLDFNVVSKPHNSPSSRALLALNPTGSGLPGWATTPSEYAEFLVRMFDAWRDSGSYRSFTIEPFVSIIRVLAGKPPDSCHFTPAKCAFVLTLFPDGRVGSCDELPSAESLLAAPTDRESLDRVLGFETNPKLRDGLGRLLEKCRSCSYVNTCGGGCLATRKRYEGTQYDDEYCQYRKRIVNHVAAAMGSSDQSLGGQSVLGGGS